jgi:hypothetical protein
VFDFYKAQMDADENDANRFDKESLQLSIDNGSLVVVLDGIDEVIAKLGDKFDVERFINSISDEYSSGLHKTKVLITCRDHFWNEVGKRVSIPEITLKAFNEELAVDFFAKKFKNDKKKSTKALDMANKLAIESTQEDTGVVNKTYIPFLLDMIAYLINSQESGEIISNIEQSKYLLEADNTDLLIAQVCKREIVKLESMSVDQQISFFIEIALKKNSSISLYDVKNDLQSIVADVDDYLIEKIKGHPLLICDDNKICFRYDVFDTYFKELLVYSFFNKKNASDLDENILNIIVGYLKFDSSFVKAVSDKLILDDDFILFCIEIIERSYEGDIVNRDAFISSIFSLLLTMHNSTFGSQSNILTRTELIIKVFGGSSNNYLDRVCLVDIFGSPNLKPTFDFRGMRLENCVFNNYQYFLECKIDESTKFINSFFKDINPRAGIKSRIPNGVFSSNCDVTHIKHLIFEKMEESKSNSENTVYELDKVFRLFYQRGNFYPRKQEEVRKKLSAVKLLNDLIDWGVIKNYKDPKKPNMSQYKISDDYKSVLDYIEQGTPSFEFNSLVSRFTALYFR